MTRGDICEIVAVFADDVRDIEPASPARSAPLYSLLDGHTAILLEYREDNGLPWWLCSVGEGFYKLVREQALLVTRHGGERLACIAEEMTII